MAGLQGLVKAGGRAAGTVATPTTSRRIRLALGGISLLLLAGFVGGSALLYRHSLKTPALVPGIRLGDARLGALMPKALAKKIANTAAVLESRAMVLTLGKHQLQVPLAKLGASVDIKATQALLARVGKSGSFLRDLLQRVQARRGRLEVPLVLGIDADRARSYFQRLKGRVDRAARKPRLDLERRKVVAGRPGYRLRIYDALAAVETTLRAGKLRVALPVTVTAAPGGTRYDGLDISHELASFSTVYSQADKDRDRGHNLKVGAAKLDGFVLRPGEQLSYNEVVGPRTKAQGYRTAHVISQGELVDGMAGGSCQLSSTLFAASFFAGLDLVSSRPHTIPSSYIKMGLDATVAYGTTDLVIKNPYDFPIVVYFKVSQGRVTVRLLGKKRPFERVEFRRVIKKKEPFKEVVRKDPTLPQGVRIVAQRGVPGFVLERQRLLYQGKKAKPSRVEKRELRYPPTTQFVRLGTGKPNPEFKPPKARRPFGDVKPDFSMSQ
jgi:vancomycin resistance protein YoaR